MLLRLAREDHSRDAKLLDMVTLKALAEANCRDATVGGQAADFVSGALLGVEASEVSALFVLDMMKRTGERSEFMSLVLGGGGGDSFRIRQGMFMFVYHQPTPSSIITHLTNPMLSSRNHETIKP